MSNDSLIGSQFGPYKIEERIAAGGMAVVYRAFDQQRRQWVALKIMHEQFTYQEQVVKRFHREVEIAQKLEHPNIVPFYESDEIDGKPYMAIKYIDGGSLADRLKKVANTPLGQTATWLRGVARALDYAHREGVIHRDLKPGNILIDQDNEACLTDFGIARVTDATQLTSTNQNMPGTARYMSPEQASGKTELDYRSDLYSLGVIAYLMTVGVYPFTGTNETIIIAQHMNRMPPLPSQANADLPPKLDDVLMRALAKDPAQRFESAMAFQQALEQAIAGYEEVVVIVNPKQENPASGSAVGASSSGFAPASAGSPPSQPGTGQRQGNGLLWLAAVSVVLLIAGLFVVLMALDDDGGSSDDIPTVQVGAGDDSSATPDGGATAAGTAIAQGGSTLTPTMRPGSVDSGATGDTSPGGDGPLGGVAGESPTETSAPTATPTRTDTPTDTDVPTDAPTRTDTPIDTDVPTDTPSSTPSATATATMTASPTATTTTTDRPTDTPTPTATQTPTPTRTPSPTATSSPTTTLTPPTPSPTPVGGAEYMLFEVYPNDADASKIWLLNVATGQTHFLHTATDGSTFAKPRFGPNRNRIVFTATQPDAAPEIMSMPLYGTSADTGNIRNLSRSSTDDNSGTFSPDGSMLTYNTLSDGVLEVWLAGPYGGNKRRLLTRAGDPFWSPDSEQIVFTTRRHADTMEIYRYDLQADRQIRLTNIRADGVDNGWPMWSPTGNRIAFDTNRDGNWNVYVMNTDGSNQIQLTTHEANDFRPTWSPDGTQIAFISSRSGSQAIYVMNADGSNQRLLFQTDGQIQSVDW